jgi:hypothetical protein
MVPFTVNGEAIETKPADPGLVSIAPGFQPEGKVMEN